MNEFVIVYNSGDTPILVGDRYVYPGQRQRVLKRYYDEAQKTHPVLIIPDENKAKPVENPDADAPPDDTTSPPEESNADAPSEDPNSVLAEKPKKQKKP